MAETILSDILRNNSCKTSYTQKIRKVNITERWPNGDWMALNGDLSMVTEWSLKYTCDSIDWMATERSLNGAFQFSWNGGISSCEKKVMISFFRIELLIIFKNLSSFHTKINCAKFGWIWSRCLAVNCEKLKTTMDNGQIVIRKNIQWTNQRRSHDIQFFMIKM